MYVEINVADARRCVEDVVFELVCTCNLKTLIYAEGSIVKLPPAFTKADFKEVKERLCSGECLAISDGERTYVLVFYTLKMGLANLAQLIKEACNKG
ncbi:hypothetical protein [Pyrobaculum aerophilum]|uniref:Uncharacterized protein n=2 Tax=Pyrobaculum aerophilum TaxID=13773 RepID=Q8ZUM5_PYRAE|nr:MULTISPECIES: hypothetical protein [Pyrobaculum]AAL64382.1 hypothetical protein PAE2707 [Pyrobaculum aerophilum str. IM2]MCX8136957.1 hypothetical protein [Pyrobaculum aerophilum]RFA97569.1 hypothetical protein CGL51_02695 [Pyrobaculum aerophilum]RFA99324.1 hypothetical protein CGL52_03880 [Pyrobaculum aerophilum]HII46785.1 hypothetical protein [Pyrobaculum aerophilum]